MQVHDFDGVTTIFDETELLTRLNSVRCGDYGACILSHDNREHPALFLHVNGKLAYLHFFPAEKHPGYQPRNMTPENCPAEVHFLQTTCDEASSIDMPDYTIVSDEIAYYAAIEFFHSAALPPSVEWFEL